MIKLHEAVEAANQLVIDSLNGALPGLNEMTSHLTQALGKGIRTHLLALASMDAEGNVPEDAVKAAAAIELLHMATLVHDDIIDDASLRRGIETVQRKFGKKRAVICGDYLLCLSVSLLTSMEQTDKMKEYVPVKRFSQALSGICRGEYTQLQNNGNLDLNLYTYFRIISGKTAALFYLSASLGAIIGGENEKNVKSLGRCGRYLGMVFQIIDDCKDYEFSEAAALKTVGKDISEGVITLPLIMAMRKAPELRAMAAEAMGGKINVRELIDSARAADGPEASRGIARRYEKKAAQALKDISGVKREGLQQLLAKAAGAAAQF